MQTLKIIRELRKSEKSASNHVREYSVKFCALLVVMAVVSLVLNLQGGEGCLSSSEYQAALLVVWQLSLVSRDCDTIITIAWDWCARPSAASGSPFRSSTVRA